MMQIHSPSLANGAYVIEHYGSDGLVVNGEVYRTPIMLCNEGVQMLPENLLPQDLDIKCFQPAILNNAEIIIVGTGVKQHFLPSQLLVQVVQKSIGIECMTTASACRTFTLLQSDGRGVWAWLWP